ncbi:MAG: aconitase X catalytic domain-containing protein [Ignavibacteriae bacterium]|nr:aconitase X catalytic domain-containing protein [Ignavibacteriota bacterium]
MSPINFIQFGEAFGADRLVDIMYCHYPAEMGIYEGMVEDAVDYANSGVKVKIPTTSSTLCSDLEKPYITEIPEKLAELQSKIEPAHRKMGILETYTCTPQLLGFIPPFGSYNALVESSAIIYYNSVLGARTNRGGMFTRFSAVTGKYPLMGYLLDENRKGTHLFKVKISPDRLMNYDMWCALGFHIGTIVGSDVPVIEIREKNLKQEWLLGLGSTLATAGSVTLFHIPGVTPEARTTKEAFHAEIPSDYYEVTDNDIDAIYKKLTNIDKGEIIDFVNLGCPHYNLEQIRYVAEKLEGKKIADGVRCWICTNRMTRKQAEYSGFVEKIEEAGAKVVTDTCPVESHMRISTCKEFGLKTPNVDAMVCNSGKMLRYVGDLIGCKTALTNIDKCIESALTGRLV